MLKKCLGGRMGSAVLAAVCLGLALLLALRAPLAMQGAREGLALCGQVMIPSLYPFFVLANVFAGSRRGGAGRRGGVAARVLHKALGQPPAALGVILLGLLGGYPTGAKTAAKLLEQGALSRSEAQRLQLFCVNAGPAYLLGAVGFGLLGSRRAGLLLFFSLTGAASVMALASRFFEEAFEEAGMRRQGAGESGRRSPAPCALPAASFLTAVGQATGGILGVCAWVVLFSTLCALLRLLPHGLWPAIPSLHVLLEVGGGTAALVRGQTTLPVICAALGFGGLSVHCQIMGDISKTGLPLRVFFASRALHSALAAAICWQLTRWFPLELPAAAVSGAAHSMRLWAVTAPAAAAVLFFCAFLILDLDLNRKI
jgi:hypothetical protein